MFVRWTGPDDDKESREEGKGEGARRGGADGVWDDGS
jgi:hypothetical protein